MPLSPAAEQLLAVPLLIAALGGRRPLAAAPSPAGRAGRAGRGVPDGARGDPGGALGLEHWRPLAMPLVVAGRVARGAERPAAAGGGGHGVGRPAGAGWTGAGRRRDAAGRRARRGAAGADRCASRGGRLAPAAHGARR